MSRGSIRYIDTSYLYGQQAVAAPVSNPVVYGRFPKYVHHKKSSVEKLNKFLSERTGQSIETIERDTERDNYMTAEEALKYGLIDGIMDKRS